MANMQVFRSAGQVMQINGIPAGTQVFIAGAQVAANADGTYPLPVNAAADVVVRRGDAVLFSTRVPATAAGAPTVVVPFVAASPIPAAKVPYEIGSRDEIRNRVAINKVLMTMGGVGAVIGIMIGGARAWKE